METAENSPNISAIFNAKALGKFGEKIHIHLLESRQGLWKRGGGAQKQGIMQLTQKRHKREKKKIKTSAFSCKDLAFPNAVVLNAVVCRNTNERKRAQIGKRAFLRKIANNQV